MIFVPFYKLDDEDMDFAGDDDGDSYSDRDGDEVIGYLGRGL